MATYYRWRRSTVGYTETSTTIPGGTSVGIFSSKTIYYSDSKPTINQGGFYTWNPSSMTSSDNPTPRSIRGYLANALYTDTVYTSAEPYPNDDLIWYPDTGNVVAQDNVATIKYTLVKGPGTFVDYVYSTSSSAYPNGGASGAYYYDQRNMVASPMQPDGLTYPETITTSNVSISWTASVVNTNYPVKLYEISYSTNGGSSWTVAGTTAETSYLFNIPAGTTSIMFRVRAKDSNNQYGAYVTGTASQVLLSPTLTVPQMVMQGQSATISWSAVEGADSYTLERKSSADADWMQVYSGANLSYTETVGTWTSLQYRVQAVFDETPGGWATSGDIQIVAASTLVISGTDGDLGTLTSDVQYSISSDQTSPTIDVTVEVNGGEYASFQATSGQTYKVGVLDLPTGTGSIVITATTTVSESPVTVTRTWTYSKTAQTFPNSGSVATLTQEGNVVYPETLVEAVRAGTPWGGNLSTALELLKKAALYNRTQTPKYNEVTVSLSGKTAGQTIQLPENGKMVEFYVSKLDYESTLNGTGRVLLVRKDCYDKRQWNNTSANTYANSVMDTWLNNSYKALFSSKIQAAMGATEFYYTPGNGNNTVTTLERAVFLLSAAELGHEDTFYNSEGSALPIANTLKIGKSNGEAVAQYTRTPANSANYVMVVSENGTMVSQMASYSDSYSRPCFTLPSTFTDTYYVDNQGTIHDQQEYTEAGDWLDVWGNAIPAVKLETGSYVGTGTYGQSNPNTLTFPFEPKVVFVTKKDSFLVSSAFFGFVWLFGQDTITSSGPTTFTVNDNGLSWYSNGASNQLNVSGTNYVYAAFG